MITDEALYGIALATRVVACGLAIWFMRTRTKRWWKLALAGLGGLALPFLVIVFFQAARVGWVPWPRWVSRFAMVVPVVGVVAALQASGWIVASTWCRNAFFGLVTMLSAEAVSFEGTTFSTWSGDPVQIMEFGKLATMLGAIGCCLGCLCLRHTFTTASALACFGVVAGVFLEAWFVAWFIDSSVNGSIDADSYDAIYSATHRVPMWIAPWFAFAILVWLRPDASWEARNGADDAVDDLVPGP